jgi:hypothetical protein
VQVGNDGGYRKLPFKPEGQVNHDADDHHQQRHGTVFGQFFAHLRADKFHAFDFRFLATRSQCVQREFFFVKLAIGGDLLVFQILKCKAYKNVTRGAKILHLRLANAGGLQRFAHTVRVGGGRVACFHHHAAGELNRQIQSLGDEKKNCKHEGNCADDVEHHRMAHEGDVTANPK